MGLFKKLIKTGFDVVSIPIDLGRDVINVGGIIIEDDDSRTKNRLKKLGEDLEKIEEELDED